MATNSPSLICENSSDYYSPASSNKGNKALTYPIGLITVDEVMLSGSSGGIFNGVDNYTKSSSNSYLVTGYSFWTMTPAGGYNFFGAEYWNAMLFNIGNLGIIDDDYPGYNSYGLRPVINIRGDVTVSGDGTMENPYTFSL